MEIEKKKWRPFRRNLTGKKGDNAGADLGTEAPNAPSKREAPKKRNGGLFTRGRKKTNKSASGLKNKPSGPVKVSSRSFEVESNLKREFKLVEELKEIKKRKDEDSTVTHRDSVSSAQESVTGDFFDHDPATKTISPASNKDNVAQNGSSGHHELTRNIVGELEQLNNMEEFIPEISDEIVSQAPTQKANSQGRKGSSIRKDEGPETVQNDREEIEDDSSAYTSESPTMPDEVMFGGTRDSSDIGDLTLFSEASDDRALGISTPPVLKRNRSNRSKSANRSRNESANHEAIKTSGTFETLRSLELVNKAKKPLTEREKRRIELDALKQDLEVEKQRVQAQLATENARREDLAVKGNDINQDMEVMSFPVPPQNDSCANPDDEVEADLKIENEIMESGSHDTEAALFQEITLLDSVPEKTDVVAKRLPGEKLPTPMKERTHLSQAPLVQAKASPVRFERVNKCTEQERTTSFKVCQEAKREFEEPAEDGIEEILKAPLLNGTTSVGSIGLEMGHEQSDSVRNADSQVEKKAKSELTCDISEEQKKRARRKPRKERIDSAGADVASLEKEQKVRLVENSFSAKGGVEIEHLSNEEVDYVNNFDIELQSSAGSRSRASRRSQFGSKVSGATGSEDDSYYDSDPDPFSGIEKARFVSLAMALKNAKQAFATAGETDALVNDTAVTKRPSLARFQRKTFFKRLKEGRDKKDPFGKDQASDKKVTRKGKIEPRSKDGTTRIPPTRTSKEQLTVPLPSKLPPFPPPSSENLSLISRGDSLSNTVLHSNSCVHIISSKVAVVGDSDIEMNIARPSPKNILGNGSVVEQGRDHVNDASESELGDDSVEDERQEYDMSDASSWDDRGSEGETTSVYSDGDTSLHDDDDRFSVAEFVHDYPVLMTVARTLSRTVSWGAGFSRRAPTTAVMERLSERTFSSEAERERRLGMNRSFSFSNDDKESDYMSSDEGSVLSADVVTLKNRFACM